jgi:flagellar biosynthesis anti-sigma factor FlgM
MKIKPGDTSDLTRMDLNATRGTRDVSGPAGSDSASSTRPPSTDSIALSSKSGLVQQAISAGSEARLARIAALRQQVESGQYQVDALAVSRALIGAHLAGQ